MVVVNPVPTVTVGVVPARVRTPPPIEYPSALTVSPPADTPPAATVTAPPVPPKVAAVVPPGHATSAVPSNQLVVAVFQVPAPPDVDPFCAGSHVNVWPRADEPKKARARAARSARPWCPVMVE